MKRMLFPMILSLLLLIGVAHAGKWTIGLGGDYETSEMFGLYSPDPNGGIGFMVMSDSWVPRDTWHNVAIGPFLEFKVTDLVVGAENRVIPGPFKPLSMSQADFYGNIGLLFPTDGGKSMFRTGLDTVFLPKWQVRPYMRTEYLHWDESDIKLIFGVRYTF